MRLPARANKERSNPKVKVFGGKPVVALTRYLDQLAFDLAQEWGEDRPVPTH